MKGTKYEGRDVAKNFTIMIWLKYQVSEFEEDNKIVEKLENRINNILPSGKLDICVYTRPSF